MNPTKIIEASKAGVVEVVNGVTIAVADRLASRHLAGFEPSHIVTACIDADSAKTILYDWNLWPGQRPIGRAVIEEYARRMGHTLWFHTTVSVALLVDDDGQPIMRHDDPSVQMAYLINGQHTLKAITLAEGNLPVTFEFYTLSEHQVQMLFSQYDDHKPKNTKDALGPVAMEFGSRTKKVKGIEVTKPLVPTRVLDKIAKAIHWSEFQSFAVKRTTPHKDFLVGILRSANPFVTWLMEAHPADSGVPFKGPSWLWSIPSVAVFYRLWSTRTGKEQHQVSLFLRALMSKRTYEAGNPVDELLGVMGKARSTKEWNGLVSNRVAWVIMDAFRAFCEHGDRGCDYECPMNAVIGMDADSLLQMPILSEASDVAGVHLSHTPDMEVFNGSVDQRRSLEQL